MSTTLACGTICILLCLRALLVEPYLICSNNCAFDKTGKFVKVQVRTSTDGKPFSYQGLSPWVPQMTVSLAMRVLARDDPTRFNYTTKFYSPYGDFVRAINNAEPDKDQYWKLCVNQQPALCGMDTYRLSEADEVAWTLANVKDAAGDEGKC